MTDLITRVLYKLRFTGEQRPFDSVSLTYMLPLMFQVLREGGIGKKDPEEADEQVILALEFLSFHTDAGKISFIYGKALQLRTLGSNQRFQRQEFLSVLISSMQKYTQHYKIIKDCLLDYCRCIADNITEQEIDVLLKGCIVQQPSVRTSVLQAINAEIDLSDLDFSEEIFLACHEDVDENVELARSIWEDSDFEIDKKSVFVMLKYLESTDRQLRKAAARCLPDCIRTHRSVFK